MNKKYVNGAKKFEIMDAHVHIKNSIDTTNFIFDYCRFYNTLF